MLAVVAARMERREIRRRVLVVFVSSSGSSVSVVSFSTVFASVLVVLVLVLVSSVLELGVLGVSTVCSSSCSSSR